MTHSHGPFAFRLEEDQVAKATYAIARKRLFKPPMRVLTLSIPVLCVLLLIVDLSDGYLNLASLAVLLAAPIAAWLVLRILIPKGARRQFRQSAEMRDEHTLTFTADSLTFSGARGTTTRPLAELHAFSQLPGILLLHPTEGHFFAVPEAAMPAEDFAALVEALEGAGVTRW